MGESHSASQVQFEIDQEIFIDSIAEGDVVEDATVATEVTLFDRIGDAYVLEGAIVFSGYTKRSEPEDDDSEEIPDALSFTLGGGKVNHFHHRLPFVLRVPVKAQPRGIVNVNSRISSWKLEVVSAGWIRILGDLTILGLNGNQGYHFQCGAQEEGDLLFQTSFAKVDGFVQEVHDVKDVDSEDPEEYADVENPDTGTQAYDDVSTENAYELVRGSQEEGEYQQASDNSPRGNEQDVQYASDLGEAEAISQARGGQPPEDTVKEPSQQDIHDNFSSNELQRLDRLFGVRDTVETSSLRDSSTEEPGTDNGTSTRASSEATTEESDETQGKVTGENQRENSESQRNNVVEFDFEHQVTDVGAAENQEEPAFLNQKAGQSERTASGPQVVLGEQPEENRGEVPLVSAKDMWSFVDFNPPDTTFTLRYVIVMEEESLAEVSERLECSREDLMRLNHLESDTVVHPGYCLAVPQRREA